MIKITVYQFEDYDINDDVMKKSSRLGTREGIERICGRVLEGTGIEIDASLVGKEILGLTARNFDTN